MTSLNIANRRMMKVYLFINNTFKMFNIVSSYFCNIIIHIIIAALRCYNFLKVSFTTKVKPCKGSELYGRFFIHVDFVIDSSLQKAGIQQVPSLNSTLRIVAIDLHQRGRRFLK